MRWRRSVLVALVLVATALGASPAPRAHAQADEKAAAEPPLQQLDAFRRNDYATAYTFASTEIQRLFDRASFERMVRSSYPEIADSVRAHVAAAKQGPDGHIYVVIRIRGANGRQIEAMYDMVQEAGAWKINGVVARPDPGEEA